MPITLLLLALAQTAPWEPLKLPDAASGKTLRGVAAAGMTAWIVGDQGLCLKSTDSGKTWASVPLDTRATLRSVRFSTDMVGFVTGDGDVGAPKATGHIVMGRQMTSGTLLWTVDGGRTWKQSHPPTNFEIPCAESRGGAVQLGNSGGLGHLDGDVLRTAAGLDSWNGKEFKSYRCFRALYDIRALDEHSWVASGSAVSVGFAPPPTDPLYLDKGCRILFSRNGGETWEPAKGSEGPGVVWSLSAGPGRLLAVGDQGAILASEDQGASWKLMTSGCEQALNAVTRGVSAVLAVGERETSLISADGGQTWKRTSSGAGTLLAVAALGNAFVTVGENGLARKASAKALLAAKAVDAPAAPKKEATKGPSKAQLERLKVGSSAVYEVQIKAPAMKLDSSFQREEKIASVSATGYKVDVQVVEGTPPPGSASNGTVDMAFESILDFNGWKVGEPHEESALGQKLTRTRLVDERVKVGEHALECLVIESAARTADGGTSVRTKSWFARSTEVPGLGVVREDTVQEMAAPQGKISITQSVMLLRFSRP